MTNPGIFTHLFEVPEASIDGNGHVNNLEYLRWMQEVAIAHSDACGWDLARYQEARGTWVIRSHHIDYLRPAIVGEALRLLTWVGGFEAQTSPRHYLVWRERDRKVLARATTQWVFLSTETGRPCQVPDEFRSAFVVVPDEKEVLLALRASTIPKID